MNYIESRRLTADIHSHGGTAQPAPEAEAGVFAVGSVVTRSIFPPLHDLPTMNEGDW
ncbi:MAG TPA: hypothetical protein VJR05_00780 [Acidimicrobiia bacterium]|nr:hypothetical protein [Acidimicrobiia bacterium]